MVALRLAETSIDNPFANLPVKIDELEAFNNSLVDPSVAAESGSFKDVKNLELAENKWNQKFILTANFVTFVAATADMPAQVIVRGGFTPTKDATTPHPLPGASTNFNVFNNGKKGAIIAESRKKISYTKGYIYGAFPVGATVEFENNLMRITMGDSTCYVAADTRRRVEFFNLPQTPLKVIVYGFNAAGSGPACQPITITPGVINNE